MQTISEFGVGQLVTTHLPDPAHNNKQVVVPGVVVVPGATQTVIRVCDLSAHIAEIAVSNSSLSSR